MKNNRCGQASKLTLPDIEKICKAMHSEHHRLFLRICWFTGARGGEVVALRLSNVYDQSLTPLQHITFERKIRKGKVSTLQQPVGELFREHLTQYAKSINAYSQAAYLFPSNVNQTSHLSRDAMDDAFRRAINVLGWNHRGYSLHSSRRGRITQLIQSGVASRLVQNYIGHLSLGSTEKYIDDNDREEAMYRVANL